MEKVRQRTEEARQARDAAYGEMEAVLTHHQEERQQLAASLFGCAPVPRWRREGGGVGGG